MEKSKDKEAEEKPIIQPDEAPEFWQLIDWVFFAGAPIGEPEEPETDDEEEEA